MEPEGLSSHSQEPATCPYSEPDRSSPCPPSHFSKIHFNIILPSTPGSFKWSHPYKTTGKIIVLCISIFIFLDTKMQEKILHRMKANISRLQSTLNFPHEWNFDSLGCFQICELFYSYLSLSISYPDCTKIHGTTSYFDVMITLSLTFFFLSFFFLSFFVQPLST
jgi:hypothetical protein